MSKNDLEEKEYWRSQVAELKSDYNHGSRFLASESLKIIEEFITKQLYRNRTELIQALSKLSNALVRAKPYMALNYNHSHEIIDFIQEIRKEERNIVKIKNLSLEKIIQLRQLVEQNFKKISRLGARLIMDQHIVFTHSASSHVEAILLEAKRLKRRFRVICSESRPRLEGLHLAERLVKAGIKTILIPDADITRAVDEANFVLTGTDRITENTFINKTGTYAIAVLAKEKNKPFYIAACTDKILLKRTYPIRFFSVNEHEIAPKENDNLTVQNIYYEEIPLDFLHKIISEKSIFEKDEFVERML